MTTELTTNFLAEALCTRTWGHSNDGIPCSACRKEAALIAADLLPGAAEARGYQKAIDALRAEAARALERAAERAPYVSAVWDMYDSAADWLEAVREDNVAATRKNEK